MKTKICELKIKDMASVNSITQALLLNGYEVQSAVMWKEFPQTGIDCFMIAIFDHPTEKVCTGKRCPMQAGYDVENCKKKDCIYRTET